MAFGSNSARRKLGLTRSSRIAARVSAPPSGKPLGPSPNTPSTAPAPTWLPMPRRSARAALHSNISGIALCYGHGGSLGDAMFVIMGATGHVGSAVAGTLLSRGQAVTIVTRNPDLAKGLQAKG